MLEQIVYVVCLFVKLLVFVKMRALNKKLDCFYDITQLSGRQRVLLSRALGLYFEDHINQKQFLKLIDEWKLPIIR